MSPFRPLTPPHLPDLLRALQTEPVTNVFLLHLARRTGLRAHGGTDFYGHRDEKGRLIGAGAFGPTLLPWAPRPETAALIADEARRRWGQWRALLGEARSIDSLWERLKP
ncbi:MAG: DUF4081 domain-containing protein, partial [Armatimonadetes bacterium]|nr:DUF4081 domain-containing protein [Armatimonadota bacterium]